jgi:kynurenine formamidase
MRPAVEAWRRGSVLVLTLLAGAALGACRPARSNGFGTPRRVVDLSPTIGEDAPTRLVGHRFLSESGLPDSTRFVHTIVDTPFYVADSRLELFNHVGPHHDAPSHVIKGATSTDRTPLDRFIGPARILDFRSKAPDSPLTRADFESRNVRPGEIVIAFVGYVPPQSPDSYPSYPYLSGEAAEYLATLPVKLFATDMPSLASLRNLGPTVARGLRGSAAVVPEHYAFLSREVPSIEGLVNLDSIVTEPRVVFVGFPLKIEDGNAGPMRAVALVY